MLLPVCIPNPQRAADLEARASAILEALPDAILTTDTEGLIESLNPAAQLLFGDDGAELIGQPISRLIPPVSTADSSSDEPSATARAAGLESETSCTTKDGRRVNLSVNGAPLKNARGAVAGSAYVARDVTQRRQSQLELECYAAQLQEQNERLARSNSELDEFAHIASHDLKEPLRGIHNYATFLVEDYSAQLDEEGRAKLEMLQRLTLRMDGLISSLLETSRLGRQELAVKQTKLDELLTDVTESLRIVLQEQQVEIRVRGPLPTVHCDRVRIGEVFHNLITNAIKYNDKPVKWIEIGTRPLAENAAGDARPSQPWALYVRDNGIGISEKHFDSVFRIFKRLHGREEFGGGTGVGLTIVKKIVERHAGRVWLESVPGEGTTFLFTLAPPDRLV